MYMWYKLGFLNRKRGFSLCENSGYSVWETELNINLIDVYNGLMWLNHRQILILLKNEFCVDFNGKMNLDLV